MQLFYQSFDWLGLADSLGRAKNIQSNFLGLLASGRIGHSELELNTLELVCLQYVCTRSEGNNPMLEGYCTCVQKLG